MGKYSMSRKAGFRMPKRSSGQAAREQKTKLDSTFEKSIANHTKATNPNFVESFRRNDNKYTENCANCTYAFEARMRGENVEAASASRKMMAGGWRNAMEGQEWTKLYGANGSDTYGELEKFMRAQGPNARFAIQYLHEGGGGHIMNGLNAANGNPRFIDAQIGAELSKKEMATVFNRAIHSDDRPHMTTTRRRRNGEWVNVERMTHGAAGVPQVSRIDNLEFNKDYRKYWDSSKRRNQGY